jgi:hypothetical protein
MLSQHLVQPFLPSVNVLLSLRRNLSLGPVVFDTAVCVLVGTSYPCISECLGWLVSWGGIRSDYGRT